MALPARALALTVIATALLPAVEAAGATAKVDCRPYGKSCTEFFVALQAEPGEANRITAVQEGPWTIRIRDDGAPLTAGFECDRIDDHEVVCRGVTWVEGSLGDGDDVYDGRTLEWGSRIDGGPGDDLLIGGPGDDRLDGGPGDDLLFGGPGNDQHDGGAAATSSAERPATTSSPTAITATDPMPTRSTAVPAATPSATRDGGVRCSPISAAARRRASAGRTT